MLLVSKANDQPGDQEVYDVLDYARDMAHRQEPIRATTWGGLVKASDRWHRELSQTPTKERWANILRWQNGAYMCWNSALQEYEHEGYTVAPLTTQRDLYVESLHMEHCAIGYGEQCSSGDTRIFSTQKDGFRIATVQLHRIGKTWQQTQTRGKHNHPVSSEIIAVAEDTADRYQAVRRNHQNDYWWVSGDPSEQTVPQAVAKTLTSKGATKTTTTNHYPSERQTPQDPKPSNRENNNMMTTVLMPLGYVDESHENGGAFSLARPDDKDRFTLGTPILIRNEHQDFNAIALMRGEITEVTGVTASFMIQESYVHPNWPDHIDPKGYGNPVYLGIAGTFDPDFNRGFATREELDYLVELAKEHQRNTGIAPRGAGYAPVAPAQPVFEEAEGDDQDFMLL